MRNAIRSLQVLGLSIAFMASLTASASALGPGGWDHLGQTTPTAGPISGGATNVTALNTDMPGKLLVGGSFTGAGQPAGNTFFDDSVAIWDGTAWSPLRSGAGTATDTLPGSPPLVLSLEFANGIIYAGGSFTDGAGPRPDFLASWDTTAVSPSWQQVCAPGASAGGNVSALKIDGNDLYVGNDGQNWGGIAAADYLFACDLTSPGGTIIPMVDGGGDATGGIKALAIDSAGSLYAGGNFIDWDGIPAADYVVKYSGGAASAMGATAAIDTTGVDSLAAIGTDVYVGTDDVNVAGIPQADNVAVFHSNCVPGTPPGETCWDAAGADTAGTNGYFSAAVLGTPEIQSLSFSDSGALVASGHWNDANGEALADDVAMFNGFSCTPGTPAGETCWDSVGSNGAGNGPWAFTGNGARGLAWFDSRLYVGGNFQNAGGDLLADSLTCFAFSGEICTPAPVVTPDPVPINPGPPLKCKKGQKLKNGKCVKQKRKKRKKGGR